MRMFLVTYSAVTVCWTSCLVATVHYGFHRDSWSSVKFGVLCLIFIGLAGATIKIIKIKPTDPPMAD